jgi:hypothetical protein
MQGMLIEIGVLCDLSQRLGSGLANPVTVFYFSLQKG